MGVRARFYVSSIKKTAYDKESAQVELIATTRRKGVDNEGFWDYTPAGNLQMSLSAKGGAAAKWFEERLGQDVYLDFSEIPGQNYRDPHSEKSVEEIEASQKGT